MKNRKVYLAIPYTGMKEKSYKIANEVAAELMGTGDIVYSPISQNHSIASQCKLPTTWEFWEKFDTEFIKWCDVLVLINIGNEGDILIKESTGCQGEIEIARKLNKEIRYYDYKD